MVFTGRVKLLMFSTLVNNDSVFRPRTVATCNSAMIRLRCSAAPLLRCEGTVGYCAGAASG
jgi:hypothetical protein